MDCGTLPVELLVRVYKCGGGAFDIPPREPPGKYSEQSVKQGLGAFVRVAEDVTLGPFCVDNSGHPHCRLPPLVLLGNLLWITRARRYEPGRVVQAASSCVHVPLLPDHALNLGAS